MKSKTSYFNRTIFFEDLKRLWGLSILYFLLIFFTGPLEIMTKIEDTRININYLVENFLEIRNMELQMIFTIMFPIVLSMLLFRYLHTIKSTTVIHSFPITRKELFHSHSLAGFILITIPIILITLVLIGIMVINNDGSLLFQNIFTMENIFSWMGKTLLTNYASYLIANLTAMITGITLIQGVLAFIFAFLPLGLGALLMFNLDQLIYGFAANSVYIEKTLVKIIPIAHVWGRDGTEIGLGHLLWYIILGLVLYFSTLYFYNKRHLEKATDPVAFDGLKPIFKYGVTFCGMVLGGAYLLSMQRTEAWLYLGYALGGTLGYFIAEMLIQKTIWVFKNIKGLLMYSIIVVVVFVGIKVDITGFERRIPDVENIESAYYGYGLYQFWIEENKGLEELNNIDSITKLHREIVSNKKMLINMENGRNTHMVGIAYRLKSGGTIYRDYIVPREFITKNQNVKNVFESIEYKWNYHNIFKADPAKFDYVEIAPEHSNRRNSIKIVDLREIEELMDVVKKDIEDETYEEFTSNLAPWGTIMLISREKSQEEPYRDNSLHIQWKKSYDKTAEWLKQKGYYEDVRIMVEDIDYVVVEKINNERDIDKAYETISLGSDWHGANKVEIRDKKKIEYFLNNYISHYHRTGKYVLGFYMKNGGNFLGWIDEDRLPKEIEEILNKQ